MKKLFILTVSVFLVLFAGYSANAQRKSQIPEAQWDAMLEKFKKVQADAKLQKEYEKELDKSVDEMTKKLDLWLKVKKQQQDIAVNNYQPGYNHQPGEMNLFPVWEEMPGPVPSLPEATEVNFKMKYNSYVDKVNMMKKQLSDMVEQHIAQQRSDKQSIMNDTKADANRNGMVQQMGGADEITKMSQAERKRAAKNAAADVRSNTMAYSGTKDAGMNAMMQKMMNDPQYMAAYNKMSDAEKEQELRKYMGNQVTERNDQAFEASMKERNDTYSSMNIERIMGESLDRMKEAAKIYSEGTELANNFYNGVYDDIAKWYQKQYDGLPETETHEKIGHAQLIKCRESILYQFHKKEAVTRTILWNLLKTNTKIAFGKFNDLIGNYPWGKTKNASLIGDGYTEPRVAKGVTSLYEEMIRMTKEAELNTRAHKGWQEQFELAMK